MMLNVRYDIMMFNAHPDQYQRHLVLRRLDTVHHHLLILTYRNRGIQRRSRRGASEQVASHTLASTPLISWMVSPGKGKAAKGKAGKGGEMCRVYAKVE